MNPIAPASLVASFPSSRPAEGATEREVSARGWTASTGGLGMGGGECALGDAAVGSETLKYGGDDVEMSGADSDTEQVPAAEASAAAGGAGAGGGQAEKAGPEGKKKKRRKRKNKGRQDVPPINIADIDRSVLSICKRLKEKKWYLVSITEECLGATAVSDLVREVEAIQKCGGQTTADGSRLRTGGGILWNILKSREPKAYNEIMARGKELEKYFRYIKRPQISRKEDASSQGSALIYDETESQEQKQVLETPAASDHKAQRKPLAERIRIPVAYDDLFEKREIHEGEPLEAFRRLCLGKSCEAQRNVT